MFQQQNRYEHPGHQTESQTSPSTHGGLAKNIITF